MWDPEEVVPRLKPHRQLKQSWDPQVLLPVLSLFKFKGEHHSRWVPISR